ncbi:hypothetical protein [Paracoccus ravus]|uniref:hypothetical protein n=1 Tax=Paracoccus ravus TaxID=2447760 RepID=UPI001430D303|nr:hypothetical protein [Paracoccus ravus]
MLRTESNIRDRKRELSDLELVQLPFAILLALNDMGKDLIVANRDHMVEVFDHLRTEP